MSVNRPLNERRKRPQKIALNISSNRGAEEAEMPSGASKTDDGIDLSASGTLTAADLIKINKYGVEFGGSRAQHSNPHPRGPNGAPGDQRAPGGDSKNSSGGSGGDSKNSSGGRLLVQQIDRTRDVMSDLHLIKALGSGSSGLVRKCVHTPTGTVVALKTIALDVQDTQVRNRILKELMRLYEFDSERIVSFLGAFLSEGSIHILLEYMHGSLEDVRKRVVRVESEAMVSSIARQVLEGLRYLHRRHIVHRDIKPGNVLINVRGEVKLADFGVSGELADTVGKASSWVGTTVYMSPERIKGDHYAYDSDLWSLGLTVLELFSGDFPIPVAQTTSFFELLDAIVEQPSPTFDPGLGASAELSDFVAVCLKKNPAERSSAEALLSHPFIEKHRGDEVDIGKWFVDKVIGRDALEEDSAFAASGVGHSSSSSSGSKPSYLGGEDAALEDDEDLEFGLAELEKRLGGARIDDVGATIGKGPNKLVPDRQQRRL